MSCAFLELNDSIHMRACFQKEAIEIRMNIVLCSSLVQVTNTHLSYGEPHKYTLTRRMKHVHQCIFLQEILWFVVLNTCKVSL